jgi:hypothetical protein
MHSSQDGDEDLDPLLRRALPVPARPPASCAWHTSCSAPTTRRGCSSSTPRTKGAPPLLRPRGLCADCLRCLPAWPASLRCNGEDTAGREPRRAFRRPPPPLPLRRGIDVVRNKIKMFAQKRVTLPPGRHKIVILDEADRWVRSGRLLTRRGADGWVLAGCWLGAGWVLGAAGCCCQRLLAGPAWRWWAGSSARCCCCLLRTGGRVPRGMCSARLPARRRHPPPPAQRLPRPGAPLTGPVHPRPRPRPRPA